MSLNKCRGCGALLQTVNPGEAGYVLKEGQEYCQRCYRLIHYGDTASYKRKEYSAEIKSVMDKYPDAVYILIFDPLEALALKEDKTLVKYDDKQVLIIINKTDLLPEGMSNEKINSIYLNIFTELKKEHPNILEVILTNHKDSSFKDLFFEIAEELGCKEFVFTGNINVGKSTLINRLTDEKKLTVSLYPGTTVAEIVTEKDGYRFIDVPGFEDSKSIITYLDMKEVKEYLKFHTVKPAVYQLYEPQSYFVSGLFRVNVLPENRASVVFESYHGEIHRTSFKNENAYAEKHIHEFRLLPWKEKVFKVTEKETFVIKGYGLFSVSGRSEVRIAINDKIKIYRSEVSF